jgi:hypothetical protein
MKTPPLMAGGVFIFARARQVNLAPLRLQSAAK